MTCGAVGIEDPISLVIPGLPLPQRRMARRRNGVAQGLGAPVVQKTRGPVPDPPKRWRFKIDIITDLRGLRMTP